MAIVNGTSLTADTTPALTDQTYEIKNPGGTPVPRKVLWSAIKSLFQADIVAKGDLLVGSAAATTTKLTVGANNTVLTADSSTATGTKWATPSGGSASHFPDTMSAAGPYDFSGNPDALGIPGVIPLSTNQTLSYGTGNRLLLFPFHVSEDIVLTAVQFEVTTNIGASNSRFSILAATSTWELNQTTAVIWSSTYSTAATGTQRTTGLSTSIPKGNYYLSLNASATGLVFRCFGGRVFGGVGLRQDGNSPQPYSGATSDNALVDPVGNIFGSTGNGSGWSYPLVFRWT